MSMSGYFHRLSTFRLEELRSNPSEIEYGELADAKDSTVEKAWNAIEYLLDQLAARGSISAIAPVTGGKEIGTNLAFGPARYLTADEVGAIAKVLASISPEALREVFDPDAMHAANVYPPIWIANDRDWLFNYVWGRFQAMVDCFVAAGTVGEAMLVYLA